LCKNTKTIIRHRAQARWLSGNIHLDFITVHIPR
jgi:hypothetical protein